MKSMWSYFENYFTPEECDILTLKCLNKGLKDGLEEGKVGGSSDGRKDTNIRQVKLCNIYIEEMRDIFAKLISAVDAANKKWFNNIDITNLEYIQFMQYDTNSGGFYTEHQDVMYLEGDKAQSPEGEEVDLHRKISFSLQLSDSSEYDDCNLILNRTDCEGSGRPDIETVRQKGTLLVFPSFLRHSVTPITRGTRYSIVGWVTGPTWR